MTTKLSFRCNKCGKEFLIKGHWYNQMIMEWLGDVRWVLHCMAKHHEKINKKGALHLLKLIVALVPLLILQILDIIVTPFRYL